MKDKNTENIENIENIYLIGRGYLIKKLEPYLVEFSNKNNIQFKQYVNTQNCAILNGSMQRKKLFENTLLIIGEFHSTPKYNNKYTNSNNQFSDFIELEKLDFLLKYQRTQMFAKDAQKYNNKIIFLNSMKSVLCTNKSKFDKVYIKYNKKVLKLSKKYNNFYNLLLPYVIDKDILNKPNTIFEKIEKNEIKEKDLNNDLIPIQFFNSFKIDFLNFINEIIENKSMDNMDNILSFKYNYTYAKNFIKLYHFLKEKK